MIISIKYVIRFAKSEMIYEMPYSRGTGTFMLAARGNMAYGSAEKSLKSAARRIWTDSCQPGYGTIRSPVCSSFAYRCDRAQQVQAEIVSPFRRKPAHIRFP